MHPALKDASFSFGPNDDLPDTIGIFCYASTRASTHLAKAVS